MDAEARRRGCRSNRQGRRWAWTRLRRFVMHAVLGDGAKLDTVAAPSVVLADALVETRPRTMSRRSKSVAGGRAGRCGVVTTKLKADDDGINGVVVDMLVSHVGKEQGIAIGVVMARGSVEAGTGSCRWLGRDAE